jgi:hypothetical protein
MSSSAPHLPLHRVALCLDCETCFEIGAASCPACGSDTWVLMTKFLNQGPLRTLSQFQPLPNSLAKAPKHRDEPSGPVVKQLLIVARDRQKLYENVKRAFSDNPTVEVILDRRSAEPRYDGRGKPERRRGGDQQRVQTDYHLRALGWAIVRLDVFRTAGQPHRSESR